MRFDLMVLAMSLGIGAVSTAWSSEEPPATQPPAAPAATAPSSAVSTPATQPSIGTAAGAAASAAPETIPDAKPGSGKEAGTEVQIKELRSRGYKAENRNGTTVWCRTETSLGTRFETKKCATADDLDMAKQRGKDFTSTIQNYGLPKGRP
jgi:hypothetical protein